MQALLSKSDILNRLETAHQHLIQTVSTMSEEQFLLVGSEGWSAADHLKHLLLSVKPLVKALQFPHEQMTAMFGDAERPSMSYEEMIAVYQARIQAGLRAEDYAGATPFAYRFPEGVTSIQAYLLEQWHTTNQRLLDTLANWSEAALDRQLIPHPAIGNITVREMLYFTAYHNQAHGQQMNNRS